ncbi:S8 family serine peptidase [Amycolatopsis sp. FDAARGOS 1241]|uniref:S8 family serine peptidase n=1 Tax=Amycolatopsis sp. FDAARGOS 1241 TaxID=2778070 RepID=UPI001EF20A41|nr:S8 family serine peptidase [Amycolatopsis sp. FDAARGOS 1241]
MDPQRLWPLTRGDDQLVAVIGTGVDAQNGQFALGQVLGGGTSDCDGRGAIAAGIVGAQPSEETTFTGVAPDAKLLALRYVDGSDCGDPGALAGAVDTAVDRGAGVILVAVPAVADSPALASAVSRARSRGAVVVSAAAATQQDAHTYPTASPGVLAVGSTSEAGAPVQTEAGDYLGISAPGANLVSTFAGGGGAVAHCWPVTDPSPAAAYVAGVAALVRAAHPSLTGDQVVTRLTLTASPPPSGTRYTRRGCGVVDAYAAVSSTLPASVAVPGGSAAPLALPAVVAAPAPPASPVHLAAGFLAVGGVVLAAATGSRPSPSAAAGGAGRRRGSRRRRAELRARHRW